MMDYIHVPYEPLRQFCEKAFSGYGFDAEQSSRIIRIGDWYNRMEDCLEEHEGDEFDYQVHKSGSCMITKRTGKPTSTSGRGLRPTPLP